MRFNNATLNNVEIQPIQQKGNGLVTRASSSEIGQSALITVPHDLVLNAEAVEEYAKEDKNVRALLDACGPKVSQLKTPHFDNDKVDDQNKLIYQH